MCRGGSKSITNGSPRSSEPRGTAPVGTARNKFAVIGYATSESFHERISEHWRPLSLRVIFSEEPKAPRSPGILRAPAAPVAPQRIFIPVHATSAARHPCSDASEFISLIRGCAASHRNSRISKGHGQSAWTVPRFPRRTRGCAAHSPGPSGASCRAVSFLRETLSVARDLIGVWIGRLCGGEWVRGPNFENRGLPRRRGCGGPNTWPDGRTERSSRVTRRRAFLYVFLVMACTIAPMS